MSDPRPPRSEPEIIPPDRAGTDWRRGRRGAWVSINTQGTQRIYAGRVGPLGFILLALLIAALAAIVFVILLGAFLIWIPVAILLFVAAIVGGLMRRHMRR